MTIVSTMSTSSTGSPPSALFQGYNSVLGNGLSTAVAGEVVNGGARSEVRCSVSVSIEELAQSLEIDQSLSVGFGPLGGIDQKMSFMSSLKVTTYSISVTVFSRHISGTRSMSDVKFKSGIVVPGTDAQVNDFVRYYGDSFVSTVTEGGEYFAVYTFYSQTREEQTKLVTSLQANGIFDGVSVGGSLQTAMNNFLKTTTINYSFRQMVSGIKNPALPMPADFIDYAVKFPSLTLDAPVLVGLSSSGYESVPGVGSAFAKVAANRLYFNGDSVVGGVTGSLVSIVQISNQMAWVSKIYAFYANYRDAKLEADKTTVDADITAIHDQMTAFASTATASFTPLTPEKLKSLQNGTPVLSYSVGTSGAWGGGGGGPFTDVDPNTYIQKQTCITALKLRSGSRVDQLSVTYQNIDKQWVAVHGGSGGGEGSILQLLAGQFVTKVWGRSGSRVDQVNFQITDGRTVGGGGSGGGAFSWAPPDGNFVMGFQGRSGSELDCIQVWYAHFNPANWLPVSGD